VFRVFREGWICFEKTAVCRKGGNGKALAPLRPGLGNRFTEFGRVFHRAGRFRGHARTNEIVAFPDNCAPTAFLRRTDGSCMLGSGAAYALMGVDGKENGQGDGGEGTGGKKTVGKKREAIGEPKGDAGPGIKKRGATAGKSGEKF